MRHGTESVAAVRDVGPRLTDAIPGLHGLLGRLRISDIRYSVEQTCRSDCNHNALQRDRYSLDDIRQDTRISVSILVQVRNRYPLALSASLLQKVRLQAKVRLQS
jgi:hypothetical protein